MPRARARSGGEAVWMAAARWMDVMRRVDAGIAGLGLVGAGVLDPQSRAYSAHVLLQGLLSFASIWHCKLQRACRRMLRDAQTRSPCG
eukprot:scaffold666_cov332-Prasinococcus_capsulatus_cf.AAC.13